MENYFNYYKILKSGYLYCKGNDSRQTFILTENLGHFSTEGVTAPLPFPLQLYHHLIGCIVMFHTFDNNVTLVVVHKCAFQIIFCVFNTNLDSFEIGMHYKYIMS